MQLSNSVSWESSGTLWYHPVATNSGTNAVSKISGKQNGLPGVRVTHKGYLDFIPLPPFSVASTTVAVFERISSGQQVAFGGVSCVPIVWGTDGKLIVQWGDGYRISSNSVSTTGAVCVVMRCQSTNVASATLRVNGADVPLAGVNAYAAGSMLTCLGRYVTQSPVFPYCLYQCAFFQRPLDDAEIVAAEKLLKEKWGW